MQPPSPAAWSAARARQGVSHTTSSTAESGVLDENEIGVDPVAGNVLFVSQCEAVREREKSYCRL